MRRRALYCGIYAAQLVIDAGEWVARTLTDRLVPVPPEARTRRHP